MDLNRALAFMKKAAFDAGSQLCKMQLQSRKLASRKDFLTDADLMSEGIILRTLASEYPDIPALSEEKGGKEITDGYLWVIDPVDGTINFFLQDDHWGISIALVENGRTIAGVVYLPARHEMFSALCSGFAWLRRARSPEVPINVNKNFHLSDSQFWVGWGKEEHGGDDHRRVYKVIQKLDRRTLYPQIRNSATADMMAVARGRISGYVFPKPEPFDIAAAALIVVRAGGVATDMEGNPWGPFSRSLVVSNGAIHHVLLDVLQHG